MTMASLLLLIILGAMAGIVIAGVYAVRECQIPWPDKLAVAFLPAIALLTIVLLVSHVVQSLSLEPVYLWAGARLTPLIGLFHGYDLYYGISDGPLLNTIYGPLAYLPYAPAALFSSPTSVVIAGQIIAILIFMGSLGVLLFKAARLSGIPGWQALCLGTGVFSLLAFATQAGNPVFSGALAGMAFGVHADAPALALGVLACTCIYGHRQAPSTSMLVLSATLATLSVWAKQIEVGILVAIGIYLLAAFGRVVLARFVACVFVVGAIISAILLLVFGASDTLLNVLVVPGRHPWYGPVIWNYLFAELFSQTWLILAVATIAVVLRLSGQRQLPPHETSFVMRNPWLLFLLAAICMVPTSVLAAIKVGGASNSFHFACYLAVMAALLLSAPGRSVAREAAGSSVIRRDSMVPACLLVLALIPICLGQLKWLTRSNRMYENSLEQAYRYAEKHPGTAFFPWMPLSTLLAEGRLYPFDYGIFDRQLAGLPPAEDEFRKHVPGRLAYVFYPATMPVPDLYKGQDRPPALQYLPDCVRLGDGGPMMAYQGSWEGFGCR